MTHFWCERLWKYQSDIKSFAARVNQCSIYSWLVSTQPSIRQPKDVYHRRVWNSLIYSVTFRYVTLFVHLKSEHLVLCRHSIRFIALSESRKSMSNSSIDTSQQNLLCNVASAVKTKLTGAVRIPFAPNKIFQNKTKNKYKQTNNYIQIQSETSWI